MKKKTQSDEIAENPFEADPGMFADTGEPPAPAPDAGADAPGGHARKKKHGKAWIAIVAVAVVIASAVALSPLLFVKLGDARVAAGEYKAAADMYTLCFGMRGSKNRLTAVHAILQAQDGNAEDGIAAALEAGVEVRITYDLNGGRFINSSRQEKVVLQRAGDFVDFYKATKDSYDFKGWTVSRASYAPDFDDATLELSLKADFAPIVYRISYTNLYSDEQKNPTTYTCETGTITLKNPVRTGYTFAAWKGTDIDGETGTVVIPQGSSGDRSYIANWIPNEYQVEFHPDVECTIENPMTVTYDDEYTFPTVEKRGYTYCGWTDGDTVYTTGLWGLTNGVSVTPVWELNTYTLQYDLGGGKVATANKSSYTVLDDAITVTDPTRFGYTFLGWTYEGQKTPKKQVTIPAHSVGNYNFKANWVGNPHVIALDLQGGSAAQSSVQVVFGSDYTLPTPTKTGYTFGGWFDGSKPYTNGKWNQDNGLKLTAKWTANQYRVTFDSAGGSAVSAMTVTYDTNVTLPTPTKTGYEFRGWYRWNTRLESGIWKTAADAPLTATWKAKDYTVALDANGGLVAQKNVTVTYDKAFALPTPTKRGHTFLGWYSGGSRHNMSGTWRQDGGASLTASWEANQYNIILDADGGSIDKTKYTVTFGRSYSLSSPSRVGYDFTGWYSGKKLVPSSGTYDYDNDLVLTADWEGKEYTVTFNANGGTTVANRKTYTYGDSYRLPTPMREGYDFVGWFTSSYASSAFESSGVWETANNVSLIAKWEASDYTVRLDADGGSVSKRSLTVTYGERYSLPTTTRTGYTFDGWYKGSRSFDMSGTWDYTSDVTLTAKWSANKYTIYLDASGGSVSSSSVTVRYGERYSLPTPTRSGYIFLGWYAGGEKVSSGVYQVDGNITAHASWEAAPVQEASEDADG